MPLTKATTMENDVPTIDLDKLAWEQIKEAASQSSWFPPDYYMNDWVNDVVRFLRDGVQIGDNADFIIEWAFENNYEVTMNSDHPDITDECNKANKWSVQRREAPYCTDRGSRRWNAPTAREAIEKCYKELSPYLAKSMSKHDYMREYVVAKPFWIS